MVRGVWLKDHIHFVSGVHRAGTTMLPLTICTVLQSDLPGCPNSIVAYTDDVILRHSLNLLQDKRHDGAQLWLNERESSDGDISKKSESRLSNAWFRMLYTSRHELDEVFGTGLNELDDAVSETLAETREEIESDHDKGWFRFFDDFRIGVVSVVSDQGGLYNVEAALEDGQSVRSEGEFGADSDG